MATTYGYDPNWTTDLGVHAPQHGADSLQGVLASIPGLSSYLAYDQYLNTQNKKRQIDEVLSNNPDAQSAIPSLIRLGPHGIEAAKQLAEGEKLRQDNAMGADIQKMMRGEAGTASPTANPALYRALGVKMNLAGKAGGAALASEADRLEKLATDKTALTSMKSAPEVPAVGAEGPQVPAPARPGGVPDYLLQSPHVGASAKSLQARIDSGMIPTAAAAEKQIENLGTAHNTMVQAKMMLEQRGAQAKELKTLPPGANAAGELTPDAKEQAAARYNIDGTLPTNLGRGTQGAVNTAAILNRAAEQQKEAGNTPEAARVNQLANKASTMALGQLVKQKNLILAFENTAMKNADLVLSESEKVDRLGSPVIDRWILAGKKSVAGDPSVARLDLAVRTFVNEYARVTTSVTGGGITSDTARKEIDSLLQSAHTKDQVRQVIDLAKTEMLNRKAGYEDQEKTLRGGIGVAAPAQATPSSMRAPSNAPAPPAGFTPL